MIPPFWVDTGWHTTNPETPLWPRDRPLPCANLRCHALQRSVRHEESPSKPKHIKDITIENYVVVWKTFIKAASPKNWCTGGIQSSDSTISTDWREGLQSSGCQLDTLFVVMPKATAHVLNVMAGVSPRPTLETYLPAMLRKGLVHHRWIDPHIPYMYGQYFTNLENHQTKVNHGESIRIYFLKWAFWWVTRQLQNTSRCSWSVSPSNILHQSFQAAKPLMPSLRMQMLILPTLDHTPSEIEWQMTIRSKLGGLNNFFRWRHDTHLTRNKHWRWYCIHLCVFFFWGGGWSLLSLHWHPQKTNISSSQKRLVIVWGTLPALSQPKRPFATAGLFWALHIGVFSPFSLACLSSSLRWKVFFFTQSSPKSSRYQLSMPVSKSICTCPILTSHSTCVHWLLSLP